MKRVLATGASNIGKAGVATMVYRWGQEFDNNLLVYDYLMQNGLPDSMYLDRIREKGGRFYTKDINDKQSVLGVIKWVTKILKDGSYSTIHINADSAYLAAGYIIAAKKAGTKNIVVHSHCSKIDENNVIKRFMKIALHKLLRLFVLRESKYYLACSKEAGVWMYGNKGIKSSKYHEIYTSERIEEFEFDEEERNAFRKEFHLGRSIVLGNIGRFSYQKNHEFLIKIFSEFQKKHNDAFLILVGLGPLKEKIISSVKKMGLTEQVIFLQNRNDIKAIYSAMDVFVMPSYFEGMPATLVEAQMSFLPCVVSEKVTHTVKFTDDVSFLNTWDVSIWIKEIEKYLGRKRETNDKTLLYKSEFNIVNASKKLVGYLMD